MASSGELISKLATLWALPENAVGYPYRVLRENGVTTKGGRGRSAARVTARDAASLMIAVVCNARAKDIFDVWKAYGSLTARDSRYTRRIDSRSFDGGTSSPRWHLQGCEVAALQSLPEEHCFLDGLTALIAAFSDGSLPKALRTIADDSDNNSYTFASVDVDVYGPLPSARIEIKTNGFSESITYRDALFTESGEDPCDWSTRIEKLGALMDHSTFTASTLEPIGNLIAE
ncbi:MAG: hypothetical protein LDL26_00030 [Caenispirillum bisanense]|nr:hypothetical protein [Caenispirillum bisanense]MCA1971256.1 hypothetical protein [Caenispirillum sp.]